MGLEHRGERAFITKVFRADSAYVAIRRVLVMLSLRAWFPPIPFRNQCMVWIANQQNHSTIARNTLSIGRWVKTYGYNLSYYYHWEKNTNPFVKDRSVHTCPCNICLVCFNDQHTTTLHSLPNESNTPQIHVTVHWPCSNRRNPIFFSVQRLTITEGYVIWLHSWLPVQIPVAFSRSPLIHVFPLPGILASATAALLSPFMNLHFPNTLLPLRIICLLKQESKHSLSKWEIRFKQLGAAQWATCPLDSWNIAMADLGIFLTFTGNVLSEVAFNTSNVVAAKGTLSNVLIRLALSLTFLNSSIIKEALLVGLPWFTKTSPSLSSVNFRLEILFVSGLLKGSGTIKLVTIVDNSL